MTQEDLNELVDDHTYGMKNSQDTAAESYTKGFRKALELVFNEIDGNILDSYYYTILAIEDKYRHLL